jgi:hypothetical protein
MPVALPSVGLAGYGVECRKANRSPPAPAGHRAPVAGVLFLANLSINTGEARSATSPPERQSCHYGRMERLTAALNAMSNTKLDWLGLLVDVLNAASPTGLTAWMRHAIDHTRDARAGIPYPLNPPRDSIEEDEFAVSVATAARLRDATTGTEVGEFFAAIVDALTESRSAG